MEIIVLFLLAVVALFFLGVWAVNREPGPEVSPPRPRSLTAQESLESHQKLWRSMWDGKRPEPNPKGK